MHFNIINIMRTEPVEHPAFLDINPDDALYHQRCDYAGDRKKDQHEELEHIEKDLAAYADVDILSRTLTFKDRNTVKSILTRKVKESLGEAQKSLEEGRYTDAGIAINVRSLGAGMDELFFIDGRLATPFDIITDYLSGWLPETLHIEGIYDAHC